MTEIFMPPEHFPQPQEQPIRKEFDFLRLDSKKSSSSHLEWKERREDIDIYQGRSKEKTIERFERCHETKALSQFQAAIQLSELVREAGGRALAVGGAVRDEILNCPPKDVDIEVYGLAPEEVEKLCEKIGKTDAVGKAFGIIKISLPDGGDLDVSLPRADSKIDVGHKGFSVKVDPNMPIREAAKRRDFTFNALAKDLLTGEIYDGFDGVKDAQNRVLRVTDAERFADDPLRVMRAAQFIARFGLEVEASSGDVIRGMIPRLAEIPRERMAEEWKKLLLKSIRPSLGLQTLMEWGIIREYYPEIHAIRNVPQEFEWHPEGDVWIHTLMVVDAAANIASREHLDADDKFLLLLASLCHDLGKAETTQFEEKKGKMRYTAHGHEPAGVKPTKDFLNRLGVKQKMIEQVEVLVANHLFPSTLYREYQSNKQGNFDKPIRHLAKRIDPSNIEMLTWVSEADYLGRGPFPDPQESDQFLLLFGYEAGRWLRKEAKRLDVAHEKPRPMVTGRELIQMGILTGKEKNIFGEIIQALDHLRDLGWDREQALTELTLCKLPPKELLEHLNKKIAS